MKLSNEVLIEDLMDRTKEVMNQANLFLQMKISDLNWKASETEWSILECIEHLNRYGDFYIPEITQRIAATTKRTSNLVFKSGLLGNYFANSLLPKEKLNKMKTFKEMNPVGSHLDKSTLEKFIAQQKQLLDLLHQARNIDLNKTKTSISISKLIRLKLGDTFRVVIYHNQRHIVQANRNQKLLDKGKREIA